MFILVLEECNWFLGSGEAVRYPIMSWGSSCLESPQQLHYSPWYAWETLWYASVTRRTRWPVCGTPPSPSLLSPGSRSVSCRRCKNVAGDRHATLRWLATAHWPWMPVFALLRNGWIVMPHAW
jgi:hypothetical protein